MLNVALGNRVSVIGMQQLLIEKVLKMKIELKLRLLCSTCGEGEDVVGVHTLLSGVVQVCHELLVGEEEEKEEEQGRQEEREVERGGQGEENTRSWMTMWMSVKSETQT